MAHSAYIQKSLVMKPEVKRIFDDLDEFLDFCRFELLPFNPADLYNRESYEWNRFYGATRSKWARAERAKKESERKGDDRKASSFNRNRTSK